jgi:hypothetical protein
MAAEHAEWQKLHGEWHERQKALKEQQGPQQSACQQALLHQTSDSVPYLNPHFLYTGPDAITAELQRFEDGDLQTDLMAVMQYEECCLESLFNVVSYLLRRSTAEQYPILSKLYLAIASEQHTAQAATNSLKHIVITSIVIHASHRVHALHEQVRILAPPPKPS